MVDDFPERSAPGENDRSERVRVTESKLTASVCGPDPVTVAVEKRPSTRWRRNGKPESDTDGGSVSENCCFRRCPTHRSATDRRTRSAPTRSSTMTAIAMSSERLIRVEYPET